jgi:hypothetical protein
MRAKNLADLYNLPLVDWNAITTRLDKGYAQAPGSGGPNRHSSWLATINADGSPHVNGVGSMWSDGVFWFETGATSRKGRNLARDPRCSLSLATEEFDIVAEGAAERITDASTVAWIAQRYAEHGWPAKVDESGTALTAEFSAPSAGPPPWHVYRMTVRAATVLSVIGEGGATRFDF